jgi:hypothetical protein
LRDLGANTVIDYKTQRFEEEVRDADSGGFEVYDILNNQITTANSLGTVGLDWSGGGFAAEAPIAAGKFAGPLDLSARTSDGWIRQWRRRGGWIECRRR